MKLIKGGSSLHSKILGHNESLWLELYIHICLCTNHNLFNASFPPGEAPSKLRRHYKLKLLIAELHLAQYIPREFNAIKLNLIQFRSILFNSTLHLKRKLTNEIQYLFEKDINVSINLLKF